MSVWSSIPASSPALESSEGALVSVSVNVEPKLLEDLLDALAHLEFPINPQIYHDAALLYVYPDGREETVPTTLVDFPAYANRLPEIRSVLGAYQFAPDSVHVTGMLDEIHADVLQESATAGEHSGRVFRIKQAHACAAH
jgi:hypothetical protein